MIGAVAEVTTRARLRGSIASASRHRTARLLMRPRSSPDRNDPDRIPRCSRRAAGVAVAVRCIVADIVDIAMLSDSIRSALHARSCAVGL